MLQKVIYMMKKMIWISYLDSSYFSNRLRHFICQMLIYRFKDMIYFISILLLKEQTCWDTLDLVRL